MGSGKAGLNYNTHQFTWGLGVGQIGLGCCTHCRVGEGSGQAKPGCSTFWQMPKWRKPSQTGLQHLLSCISLGLRAGLAGELQQFFPGLLIPLVNECESGTRDWLVWRQYMLDLCIRIRMGAGWLGLATAPTGVRYGAGAERTIQLHSSACMWLGWCWLQTIPDTVLAGVSKSQVWGHPSEVSWGVHNWAAGLRPQP